MDRETLANLFGVVPATLDDMLNEREAAEVIGVAPSTLGGWRVDRSDGPRFFRISHRCVRYRREDVLRFLAPKIVETRGAVA